LVRRRYNPGADFNLSPSLAGQGETLGSVPNRVGRSGRRRRKTIPVNVFYEEDGGFKVAAVMSEGEASCQVEAAHGKRSKIKSSAILLRFTSPGLGAFLPEVEQQAGAIDLDFLWEVAPKDEFGFSDLASEYFGRAPSAVEAAALITRLHGAPMYFYKKGRGRYKPAPEESLKAALASVERKKREAELTAQYADELARFALPEALRPEAKLLLYKPDKQSVGYKALESACAATGMSAPRLLHRAGALDGPYDYFQGRFVFEHFPRGTGFPAHAPARVPGDLPLAGVQGFSIDDASTTEIDDAFSVGPGSAGRLRIGIHIAAPSLGFSPESAEDAIARARMSTVYMPGDKITMLPDALVEAFTLKADGIAPCVSLYIEVEPADMAIAAVESRVESIRIAANLRHHELDPVVSAESLDAGGGDYAFAKELAILWRLAKRLEADRGKPANNLNFRDYNFNIDWPQAGGRVEAARVRISERKRGAPLDRIVSELMIYANSTWGRLLADRGAAGIYRVKTGVGPAGKVRMTSVPARHIGLGVSHYAWSSSPLRRYVDLVNQWQLVAVLAGARPPFAANSEMLLGSIAAFDAAYTAYADFQSSLERFWCLRWLEQEGFVGAQSTLAGGVTRDGSVRLEAIPLTAAAAGMPELPAGTQVLVRVRGIDLWQLSADLLFAGESAPPAGQISDEDEETSGNSD
jgi:exoribonuclease-2